MDADKVGQMDRDVHGTLARVVAACIEPLFPPPDATELADRVFAELASEDGSRVAEPPAATPLLTPPGFAVRARERVRALLLQAGYLVECPL